MPTLTELFKPHARQRDFLAAVAGHRYILYGGAGGGGKSYLLRWTLISLLLEWAAKRNLRNVRVGLFSSTYVTLADRQISKLAREVPAWLGRVKKTQNDGLGLYLNPAYGGGAVLLRNLADPEQYRSSEFAGIGVEELTENQEQVFHDLRFRLRWPGIEDTKFLAATNPGNIGHHYVKRLWIDRDFPKELAKKAPEFAYVPAKATDNPHNADSYHDELDSLPENMRAAVRDGSWDVFTGQKFTEFRREIHVCEPFAIPTWWERWGSNDPGYSDPGVWYRMAADEKGTVYIYREQTFYQTAPSEQGKAVKKDLIKQERLGYWVSGMDAFVADKETGKSWVDYYGQSLTGFRKPVHGAGARRQRAATFHEYLRPFAHPTDPARQVARVVIFAPGKVTVDGQIVEMGCPKLIETLPSLVADQLDPEAVAECGIDHWYDAAGYGLQSRHARSEVPKVPQFKPGTLGDILGHADVLAEDADDE